MWNTNIFVMGLLGTLILSFGIYSTIKVSSLKSFSFKGTTRKLFIALGIALSYVIAVYVAVSKTTAKAFVNPATVLMASIQGGSYNELLPNIAGEFTGAIIGVVLALLLFRAAKVEKVKYEFTQMKFTVNFHNEMMGSIIFLTGVIVSISSIDYQFSGVIIGLSAFIAMLIFGHKFVLLLNPATGLAITLGQLIENKFVGAKAAFINYAIAIFANLAVAASIGGIAYSLRNY